MDGVVLFRFELVAPLPSYYYPDYPVDDAPLPPRNVVTLLLKRSPEAIGVYRHDLWPLLSTMVCTLRSSTGKLTLPKELYDYHKLQL